SVRRAVGALHEPRALQTLEQPRDAGLREEHLPGEVDPPHPPLGRAREREEDLVVVDGQLVLGLEVGVHLAGERRVRAQQRHPGARGAAARGAVGPRRARSGRPAPGRARRARRGGPPRPAPPPPAPPGPPPARPPPAAARPAPPPPPAPAPAPARLVVAAVG